MKRREHHVHVNHKDTARSWFGNASVGSFNNHVFPLFVNDSCNSGADDKRVLCLVCSGSKNSASGGTLNPGSDGVGALSFRNALTLAAGSTTSFQIHSTNDFTSINLIGTSLTYGGTLVFNLINFTPVAGNEFSVFNMSGGSTESGNFERIEVGTSYLNYAAGLWSGINDGVTYQFNDATGKLTVQAIPEPSTWALLGLGALGMLMFNRGRKVA